MKRLLFGDLHWQNPSYNFITDRALSKVFKDQIWPYAEKHQIKIADQFGDFTHDKKQINKQTAKLIHESFTQPAKDLKMEVHLICGNHDAYFRNSNEVNSLQTLFSETDFAIIDTAVRNNGVIAYVPWGLPLPTGARYIFTHAEIKGFEYQRGVVSKTGLDVRDFAVYDKVFAGHFHRKSLKGNVLYLGSLIALNFGEVDTEHGFYVFDDATGEYEFIKTEIEIFKKIIYQNGAIYDDHSFENKVVSITVLENEDKLKYNTFLENVYAQHPVDVKIMSIESELKNVINVESVDGIENILSLSKKYIEELELVKPMDTKTLYDIFERTYKEALTNV
jgi:hypothetical protein